VDQFSEQKGRSQVLGGMSQTPPFIQPVDPNTKVLSLQESRRIERAARTVDVKTGLEEELKAFCPRDFILFSIPHNCPPGGTYVRRNGDLVFKLIGDEKVGLPHGQDRLLPIFVATAFAAVGMPESNIFCFRSVRDVLHFFGYPMSGVHSLRIRDWFRRWHSTTMLCYRKFKDESREGEEADGYRIVRRYRLWYKENVHPNQHSLFWNLVEVDHYFGDDLRKNPVPISLDLIRALKANSGALGFGCWVGYRSHTLATANQEKVQIQADGPTGLLAQLGCEISDPWKARQTLRRWEATIRSAWPKCPMELVDGGRSIIVHAERGRRMELPSELCRSVVPWTSQDTPFGRSVQEGRHLIEGLLPGEKPGGKGQ
jgi:hypothetical protein